MAEPDEVIEGVMDRCEEVAGAGGETVDRETGEVVEISAGGRSVRMTAEQLERAAESDGQLQLPGRGMGRFGGLTWRTIHEEWQLGVRLHAVTQRADAAFEPTYSITIQAAPERLSPYEAGILRGMLDRALKAVKAGG